jgi:hypothetical protein
VLWIRIGTFLGLLDPHPDTLDRGTDPRIRIRIPDPYQNVTDPQHCLGLIRTADLYEKDKENPAKLLFIIRKN